MEKKDKQRDREEENNTEAKREKIKFAEKRLTQHALQMLIPHKHTHTNTPLTFPKNS